MYDSERYRFFFRLVRQTFQQLTTKALFIYLCGEDAGLLASDGSFLTAGINTAAPPPIATSELVAGVSQPARWWKHMVRHPVGAF